MNHVHIYIPHMKDYHDFESVESNQGKNHELTSKFKVWTTSHAGTMILLQSYTYDLCTMKFFTGGFNFEKVGQDRNKKTITPPPKSQMHIEQFLNPPLLESHHIEAIEIITTLGNLWRKILQSWI